MLKKFEDTNSPEGDPTREHNRHKAAYAKMSANCKRYMTKPINVNGKITVQTHAASRSAEQVNSLGQFVKRFQHNMGAMDALNKEVEKALECILALGRMGISHGNLHGGNILVVYTSPDKVKIKIIDWGGGAFNNQKRVKFVKQQVQNRITKTRRSKQNSPSR